MFERPITTHFFPDVAIPYRCKSVIIPSGDVDWVKTIYILTIVDCLDYLLLVDVARKWQLHYKPVDITVSIQLIDAFE